MRRYYYAKVKGYPQDADAPDDLHFRFGKALHTCLEKCLHDPAKHHVSHLEEAIAEQGLGKIEHIKIGAMLMNYFAMHLASGLKCVACEETIENEQIIGYIDAVMADANGYWWIVDIKTSSRIKPSDLAGKLHLDLQLNLYASFADNIACKLQLDPKKFMGCRYRSGEKPDLVVKDIDTIGSYHTRAYPLFTDFEIPKELLNPKWARSYVEYCYDMSISIRLQKEEDVLQNFSDCTKYFRPCEYWSRCYGQCHSAKPKIEYFTQATMKDRTVVIPQQHIEDPFAELATGFDFLGE